ncbi:MAG: hypothetical protein COA50_06455 [Flavobacteriaceae bacterium]|nr:MAG: hypothetical protein COA50_06455 [Flavobacteriaceae bacterium]
MRKYILPICLFLFVSIGCEDVIEVDVPTEDPRLLVEALLRVDINEPIVPVRIKVSLTNNFFEKIPVTQLENIVILIYTLDDDDEVANVFVSHLTEETPASGIYYPDPSFSNDQRIHTSILDNNIDFYLQLTHEGKIYIAKTRYVPVVPIENLEQGEATLFDKDDTEVIVTYTDAPDREDFYLFDFGFNNFEVTEDTFYQGQEFQFSYFYDEDLEPGREIEISILGADRTFYNYMSQLIEVSRGDFNVFSTPVATIRGNIFDVTGLDNIDLFDNVEQPNVFPLGYFAIVQEQKQSLVIE